MQHPGQQAFRKCSVLYFTPQSASPQGLQGQWRLLSFLSKPGSHTAPNTGAQSLLHNYTQEAFRSQAGSTHGTEIFQGSRSSSHEPERTSGGIYENTDLWAHAQELRIWRSVEDIYLLSM